MEENINLLQNLNVDCLIEICKYLPLDDKVNLCEVCPQLESFKNSIFRKYTRLHLKKIENNKIPRNCRTEDIEKIYKCLGNILQMLKISLEPNNIEHHLISASIYSQNLQRLVLFSYAPVYLPRSVRFRNLKRLDLYNITLSNYYVFYLVPNITELYLTKVNLPSKRQCLPSLNFMHELESISFLACPSKPYDLLTYLSSELKLKYFTFRDSGTFYYQFESLKFLRYLLLDCFDNVPLDKFEFLEVLIIISKDGKLLSLKDLLNKKTLKVLDAGKCVGFKDSASELEICILNNPNLKYLNLHPDYFSEKVIQNICAKLNLKPIETYFDIKFDETTQVKFIVSNENLNYLEYPSKTKYLFERMSTVANYKLGKCLLVSSELFDLCKIIYVPKSNKRFKRSL